MPQRPNLQSNSLVAFRCRRGRGAPQGALPVGLVERSDVQLVFPIDAGAVDSAGAPAPVSGRVVGLPGTADPVTGEVSVSVEVLVEAAATVAAAAKVRLVLLAPGSAP